ncbi:MAG: hypothetical protein AAF202_07955 [Pseudomonadota bacterium]
MSTSNEAESEAREDYLQSILAPLYSFDKLHSRAIAEQIYMRTVTFDRQNRDKQNTLRYLSRYSDYDLIIATEDELLALKAAIQQAYVESEKAVESDEATALTANAILAAIDSIIENKAYVLPCEAEKIKELLSSSYSDSVDRYCDINHPEISNEDISDQCKYGAVKRNSLPVPSHVICSLRRGPRFKAVSPIPSFEVQEKYWFYLNGWKVGQRFDLEIGSEGRSQGTIALTGSGLVKLRLYRSLNDVD